jgi:predicted ATP-dependent serine protease
MHYHSEQNRSGSCHEIGVFEIDSTGIGRSSADPPLLFTSAAVIVLIAAVAVVMINDDELQP